MPDTSYRIFVRKIQIRTKYAPRVPRPKSAIHVTVSVALKAGDATLAQEDSNGWGDLDWKLRPPVELPANEEVSVVISPASSETRQSDKILATATFADVLAQPRRNPRRVCLRLEHELATVWISFIVVMVPPVPLWDYLKLQFWRYLGPLLLDERSNFAPAAAPPPLESYAARTSLNIGCCGDPKGVDVEPASAQETAYGGNVPQAYAQQDFDAALVDSGRIQYTVVGTKRPRPG
ncbi:hypothetical protein AB1N83_010040 [Pleurotus pulmonarius]